MLTLTSLQDVDENKNKKEKQDPTEHNDVSQEGSIHWSKVMKAELELLSKSGYKCIESVHGEPAEYRTFNPEAPSQAGTSN